MPKISFIECQECEAFFNELNELDITYCYSGGSQYLKKYCCPECGGDLDFFAGFVENIEDDKFNFRLVIYNLLLIDKDYHEHYSYRVGLVFPGNKGFFLATKSRKIDINTYEDAEKELNRYLEYFNKLSKEELGDKLELLFKSKVEMPSTHEIYSVNFEVE